MSGLTPPSDLVEARAMTCPKCGFQAEMKRECLRCGVVFAKLAERSALKQPISDSEGVSSATSSAVMLQPAETAQEITQETTPEMRSETVLTSQVTSQGAPPLRSSVTSTVASQDHSTLKVTSSQLWWSWAKAPRDSIPDAIAVCLTLEQALGFHLDLNEALKLAPVSRRAQAYLAHISSHLPEGALTFSQRLDRLALLPSQECRLIAVAERYHDPLQGVREARLALERRLARRRAFTWSLKLPRYLAVYTLLSELIYSVLLGHSLLSPITMIATLTIIAYPLSSLLVCSPVTEPWINRVRYALLPAESRLHFARTWARLIHSGGDPAGVAKESLSVAQLPPHVEVTLRSLYQAPAIPDLHTVWRQAQDVGLVSVALSTEMGAREVARGLFKMSLIAEREARVWTRWGAVVDRVIASALIAAYLTYQAVSQLSQVLDQVNTLGGLDPMGITY